MAVAWFSTSSVTRRCVEPSPWVVSRIPRDLVSAALVGVGTVGVGTVGPGIQLLAVSSYCSAQSSGGGRQVSGDGGDDSVRAHDHRGCRVEDFAERRGADGMHRGTEGHPHIGKISGSVAAGEQCPAVAHGKGIVGGGGQWQANQAMVAHFENTVLKPWEPAAAITRVECPFAVVCDGIDELSSVDGMGHLLSGVGSSLSVIGVEKMWLGVAMGNRCELPGQVLGVAHATAHSLAVEGWHLMGRVSCEEDGSITETLGDDSVKAIGGYEFRAA
jgi:hypothetical protein